MEKETREGKSIPRKLRKWVLLSLVAVLGATGAQEEVKAEEEFQCGIICQAARNEFGKVRALIEKEGYTQKEIDKVLRYGVQNCNREMIKFALANGANKKIKVFGYPLIVTAGCNQCKDLVRDLIE